MCILKNVGAVAALTAAAFWSAAGQSGNEPSVSVSQQALQLEADPHLVAWWKFDETGGTKAADSSGHGHDGILEGAFSFGTHSAAGQVGKALRLDAREKVALEGLNRHVQARLAPNYQWLRDWEYV